jgi:catechol 2,3-dioxygenase-like lactoylglutathione lyase family enzyme
VARVQLALNVDDIDEAIWFYSQLFATGPAKRRPGYSNFALDEPALKVVRIENPGRGGSLNHLGVEVADSNEVVATADRLQALGMATAFEQAATCCYAGRTRCG